MPVNVKALIVVLALSGLVFAFARSTALHFMQEEDYKRRRNTWLILSAAAFLSPNIWLFSLVAAPTLYFGSRKDTNPLAFYVLLMNVIPSFPIQIPTAALGINKLFGLDIFRLLSFCVLLPAAWRLRKSRNPESTRGLQGMDVLLIAFGALQVALYVPPDLPSHIILHSSFTNALRETFLFLVDMYVIYYVASRSCSSRSALIDTLAAFSLSCTIMASIAVFESFKHWLLYSQLYLTWGGSPMDTAYMMRAGALRAEASSGNALALGYLLAIAFGFWLYLQSRLEPFGPRIAVSAVLWLGLLASGSRGTWLGAVLIYFAFAAFSPGAASRVVKSGAAFLLGGALVLISPLGTRITKTLPFLGGRVAESTLNYRELLLDRSLQLIQAHPFFGDQLALFQMQDLRQGQGIIDLVNTYVGVALFQGLIGLTIFLAFILASLFKARSASKLTRKSDPDWSLVGASIIACILGTLFMLANCSFILGYATTFFVLAGLAAGYSRPYQSPARRSEMSIPAVQPSELR